MNIILQHFDGELRELDKLSMENIRAYADMVGAEYRLITGKPFRQHLTSPCQKVHMISESFDAYDQVLMLDIDMFATKGLNDNIFKCEPGIGLFADVQQRLRDRLAREGRIKPRGAYWGGAIYKMSLEHRKALRTALCAKKDDSWMNAYNQPYHYEDEGIIAELAGGARVEHLVMNRRWCQCSFLPKLVPGFVHIRTKVTPTGPKRDKLDNYKGLVDRGLI